MSDCPPGCHVNFNIEYCVVCEMQKPEICKSVIYIHLLQCKYLSTLKRLRTFATWKWSVNKNYQGPIVFTSKYKLYGWQCQLMTLKKWPRKSHSFKCYLTLDDLFPEFIWNATLSFSGSLPAAFRANFKWESKLAINWVFYSFAL